MAHSKSLPPGPGSGPESTPGLPGQKALVAEFQSDMLAIQEAFRPARDRRALDAAAVALVRVLQIPFSADCP